MNASAQWKDKPCCCLWWRDCKLVMKITLFSVLFCFDFVTWFCDNLNRHASLLRNALTGNQTASFYFQVGIYSVVLSHHFARTKYIYIFRVQHTKKDSLLAKTFLFFISLHTYRKLKRVTKNEKEMVSFIAVFQINTLRK